MAKQAPDLRLLALCAVPFMGPVAVRRLLRRFGSPEAVFRASPKELIEVEGIGERKAEWIKAYNGFDELAKTLELLADDGVRVVLHGDEDYPEMLLPLGEQAPVVLYMMGYVEPEDQYSVAMVGSRDASPYGMNITRNIAHDLASMGIAVVSGMARGIDTAAHLGSIDGKGRGLAVLGSGIDVPYPAENRGLMEMLARNGAVMTEFAPGTRPMKENFPQRNRLIAALSLGVVIVEAALKSGSLITARYALDQNKEVFAVPGNVNSTVSAGTNQLIKDGARMVTSAEDIIAELAPALRGFIKKAAETGAPPELAPDERKLCAVMSGEPRHIDDICRASAIPAARVLGMLLELELKGVVRQTGGKRFHLAR